MVAVLVFRIEFNMYVVMLVEMFLFVCRQVVGFCQNFLQTSSRQRLWQAVVGRCFEAYLLFDVRLTYVRSTF